MALDIKRKTADWQNFMVFFDMIKTMETAIMVIGPTILQQKMCFNFKIY